MYRAMTSAVQARPTQYATGAGQHYDGSAVAALAWSPAAPRYG